MVSGFGEFDCELMKVGNGKILTKRGAEGFQAIGLLPGALSADSRGIGIAFKVSDGDAGTHGRRLIKPQPRPPGSDIGNPASTWRVE